MSLSFQLQLKPSVLDLMSSSVVTDVEDTFDNISKLYDVHRQFVTELQKTVANWSPQTSVGEHLRTLVSVFCLEFIVQLEARLQRNIGNTLRRLTTLPTRSAITPPKVN